MRLRSLIVSGLGWTLGFLAGCDAAKDCHAGSEGCMCYDDASCLEGLVCLSEYCVDPNWTAPGPGSAANDGEGSQGENAPDNVGACESFAEEVACGTFDFAEMLQCDAYAGYACDVTDYFDCLRDHTACTDGVPVVSGWQQCTELAECH